MAARDLKIGFVHNAFPVLSETFISKEMLGLKELGMNLKIYSLFRPSVDRLDVNYPEPGEVHYLLDGLKLSTLLKAHLYFIARSPMRYCRVLFFTLRRRQTRRSYIRTLFDFAGKKELAKEQRQDLLLHFFLAAELARLMKRDGVNFLNSHFADAAAGFTMLSAKLLGLEYGVTAHAYDIFTPQYNLPEKIGHARFLLTCTRYNKKSLMEKYPQFDAEKIVVFYHGIDTSKFAPSAPSNNPALEILAVGRLTAKKGFNVLLQACAVLRQKGVDFICRIIGDGEEKEALAALGNDLNLQDCVHFVGAVPTTEIKPFYERADIFALPCVIDKDGNRDGIPNVIAEAMAMELPVVSTHISGIPELVQNGETGLLVEPHDVDALADALQSLMSQPAERTKMGKNGRKRVLSIFDSRVCLENLYTFYMNELSNGE